MKTSLKWIGCFFVVIILASPVFGATWNGGVDDLASNPLNWTGNLLPPYGDTIFFDAPSPRNCTWDLNQTYAALTIGGGFAGTVTLNSTLTLTNPVYTVTYNGNDNTGGSVPNDYTDYQQGQIVIVLGNPGNLVKDGYSFSGWNTQADGNGTTYTQDQSFTMGSTNVTLYAKWTAAASYPLIISEYVEGSSSNKALEIWNTSTVTIDLQLCSLKIYVNGGGIATGSLDLSGSLASHAVWVLCNSALIDTSHCNEVTGSTVMQFNGNDALQLVCDGMPVDVFGQIGFNPGTGWGSNSETANHTLRRKCTISEGDTVGSDAFDPSMGWDVFPQDTFDGLGWHCN